ncbi:MAG: hypothetical protein FD123_4011 [Bacteroidetes bacterium]|nr:MAG: hypothetical protein FD123_4011 [Bacteroidota bacterium]
MRTFLATFLITASALSLHGQQIFPPDYHPLQSDDSSRFEITAFGGYSAASDAITNAFMRKLYLGGYIDTTLKENVYDRLRKDNRFGLDDEAGIYFRWTCPKQPDWSYFASLRSRQHADGFFTGDGFRFAFSGNRPFAGKTIDASSTNFRMFSWKQVQGGAAYTRKTGNNGTVRLFGALSAYAGSSLLEVDLDRASLFTDSLAFFLDADAAYSIRQSDTAVTGFGAMNGAGGGIDLGIHVVIPAGDHDTVNKLFYSLSLHDIGWMHWNTNTLNRSADTSFHFEGYALNLDDLADSTINGFTVDTLKTVNEKKAYTHILPWWINSEYGYSYRGNLQKGSMSTSLGIRFRNNGNMLPDFYLKQSVDFGNRWKISLDAGYGGYCRFHAGLDVQGVFAGGWLVRIGSNNIAGYLVPDKTTAQGAYLALGKRF